jgi:hypothetical protein
MKIKTLILLVAASFTGSALADGIALRSSYGLQQASAAMSGPATATTNSNSTATAMTSSQGGAAQGVGSQGQALSIDSHAVYEAQQRNPVATAIAPALTSSNDTCMGSTSVGGSAVSFAFSVGSSWTDENCVMLKNAREIWNMGFKGAALARLCMDALNKEALEATGIQCPTRSSSKAQSSETAAATTVANDNRAKQDDLYAR